VATKLSRSGYEISKLLQSKKGGAGGVLARTTGRALSNLYPPLVAGWGLLRRHFGGVRAMRELEMALNVEAEWVLERLSESFTSDTDRNYYQGRLDQLAQVRRILGHNQLLINK